MASKFSWLLTLVKFGTMCIFGGIAIVCAVILYLSPTLPSVDQLRDVRLQTPLKVFSANGKLIGEFGEQKRTPIDFEQIPPQFIHAILSAEDDNFFNHHGVDPVGLLRAGSQILTSGEIQSGGSTITMQVARNFFLTRKQTFTRKFNEILLALEIEHELSKEEILELYANKIYLGKRAYGIQAAANIYYGADISTLNLAQFAMIAGLPKAPSAYNPINNPQRALIRRDWILGRMHLLGYITQEEMELALAEPISAGVYGDIANDDAPYVSEMVRAEMLELFGPSAYEPFRHRYRTRSGNRGHGHIRDHLRQRTGKPRAHLGKWFVYITKTENTKLAWRITKKRQRCRRDRRLSTSSTER